ncbi:WD40-repeat-containing domain protein [Xylaria bambusicola]|uniref:WD40-repeat-containing domain protein n=1 Tax=Xylaria bambusicola TaxID=326684 RepID=UPI0020076675|nr:WD40-repeat-containing domain protein [Xylaria bambusicola]KAI0525325.1 WD40-repeat-containing domain protein [Xylaria bambusicola]
MDTPMGQPAMAAPQEVRVNFTTSSPELKLPEDSSSLIVVPTDLKRYGLSRILNSSSMLNTSSPIPFDFLINGEFLRTSLQEYLEAHGQNAEETLTVQYVRSLLPPVHQASFEHSDWISDVDVLSATSRAGIWSGDKLAPNQDRIVSASYDGFLEIWDPSGKSLVKSSVGSHTASAKAAKFISSTQIASSGLDRTVRIWKYAESDGGLTCSLKPSLELYGHSASVEALDVHGPTSRVLSASADGAIGLWTTSKSSAPAAPANLLPGAGASESKKRKLAGASAASQRGPLSLMSIHNSTATAVCFDPTDASVAYSASQDHTIRTIDLTTSKVENVITTSHPLLALTPLHRNPGTASSSVLLAAATAARHITLVDPRVSASATSVLTLRGHKNMVSSLAAGPDNDYSLVSGSYDGTCRIWDLRSARAATKAEGGGSVSESVYVIERESLKGSKQRRMAGEVPGRGVKVFGIAWDKTFGIVSGGEDKLVQINRGQDLLASS